MSYVSHATCMICGRIFTTGQIGYVCPDHHDQGVLDIGYDYDLIRRNLSRKDLAKTTDNSIFRYRPLLPIAASSIPPPLTVGGTPLLKYDTEAKKMGLAELFIKDDSCLPTSSFKDRASVVALMRARERGAKVITTASTGNAAAALSGLCASVGQDNVIFVPATAPRAKIVQLLVYGSKVVLVKGSYDEAFELCLKVAAEYGWYNRNTGYNPFMSEGKKSCLYEICEQLDWSAPEAIFVSVGDGCIIGGLHKGCRDLLELGWIEKMPKFYGIQAEGSNYLAEAWEKKEDVISKPAIAADTVADSISAGLPRDRIKALRAVTASGGAFITVSDDEIIGAIADLASSTGIFAEPAGAATWAGLKKASSMGMVGGDDRVVMVNTGSGLKDIVAAEECTAKSELPCLLIPPDIEEFRGKIDQLLS